jgi:hypothetical protein
MLAAAPPSRPEAPVTAIEQQSDHARDRDRDETHRPPRVRDMVKVPALATIPFPRPSRVEVVALEETVRYLRRVNIQTATILMLDQRADAQVILDTLRGGSLSCASFCEQVLELHRLHRELAGVGLVPTSPEDDAPGSPDLVAL